MNHPLLLLVLWVSVFIISILFASSVFADSDNKQYTNCSSSFSCGVVNNVGFPFWGYNRADYCGLPDFQLDCENNVAKLIVNSVTYRILDFNFTQQTLTVARDDYWSTICPTQNKNNTIDGSSFNYASGLQYLALLYDCIDTFNPSGLFVTTTCQSGTSTQNVYYGNESSSTNLGGVCDVVIIPIFETYSSKLFSNPTNLEDVIDDGFGLQWSDVDNDNCQKCVDKGGECGYSDSKFACYCKKGPCSVKSSSKRGIGIGVGVGAAAIIVILVGCFVCLFIMRRRKRNIPENLEESKDKFSSTTPTAASSKDDGFTSTTNLSQSVPAYPSSNFESKSSSVHKSFYFGVQVFSYAELEEATKNFDPSMELGDGGFGTVYYGSLKDGRVVAVKRHYESSMKRVEQFMTEVEILARLRHHNLVTLYGCTSRHSRELLLVYEYIPNGTLADHLHHVSHLNNNNNNTVLPWPVRLNIAVETASALAYLHKSDVIHRDVKTNNILLDHSFHVKVADFGLSRFYPKYVTHVSTAPQGTPGYVDPEYYRNYQLTDKSDVYSFGVVLVELISSLEAVDVKRHKNDINLANMAMTKIQNHELDDLVDPGIGFGSEHGVRRMVTAVAEVAFRCLQPDRDMRPSMNEVLEVLRGIQSSEDYNNVDDDVMLDKSHKIDEIILLKHVPDASYSPNSVTHKWVSTSTP